MNFGLFVLMQRDDQWDEPSVYDSAMEQMLAAEPLGYPSVWIAEHHFNDYGARTRLVCVGLSTVGRRPRPSGRIHC